MKNTSRLLAMLLALVMCLSALGTMAEAAPESDFTYSVRSGSTVLYTYKGNAAEVEIPAMLGGSPVTTISENAFEGKTKLKKVVVPEGVARIGYRAFAGCTELLDVVLPNSIERIDDSAFDGCEWFKIYTDSEYVRAYAEKHGIATRKNIRFEIPPVENAILFETSVSDEGARIMFYSGASGFFAVPEKLLGGKNVYAIADEAFAGNDALYAVQLPESITRIGYRAFADCKGLTQIVLPMQIESIDDAAFEGCGKLTLFSDMHSDAIAAYAEKHGFEYKALFEYSMKAVQAAAESDRVVLLFDNGAVVKFDENGNKTNLFPDDDIVQIACGGYHTVGLKSDGTVVAVGYNDYKQCNVGSWKNIVQVAGGGWHTVGLKSDGTVVAVGYNEFKQCDIAGWTNVDKIDCGYFSTVAIRKDNTVLCTGQYSSKYLQNINNFRQDYRWRVAALTPPGVVIEPAIATESEAVATPCEAIATPCEAVATPCEAVATPCEAVATPCEAVATLSEAVATPSEAVATPCEAVDTSAEAEAAPESDFTYSVRSGSAIIYAYSGSAAEVEIPDTLGGYPVTAISESAFEGSATLKTLKVPEGVARIGYRAFADCTELSELTLPNSITLIDETAFADCNRITVYTNSEYVREFAGKQGFDARENIQNSMPPIEDETLFKSLVSDEGARIMLYSGESGFFAVPEKLGGKNVYAIADEAFAGNDALYAVQLPESITRIGYRAFADCKGLTQIMLPMQIESIDDAAFEGCGKLTLFSDMHSDAIAAYAEKHGFEYKALFELNVVQAAAETNRVVLLFENGAVVKFDENGNKTNLFPDDDIVQIACGNSHTVGLKSDGSVVAVGKNEDGQCDVDSWKDIVQVACGWYHTVGLKSDGTVVAVGYNGDKRCNVGAWKDIVQVACRGYHTVGLKSDGTVVAVGDNDFNQCNVDSWNDIVQVACGSNHSIGLKSDGTVVAVGNNDYKQCDVGGWTNVDKIDCGALNTVAIRKDNTVLYACEYNSEYLQNINNFRQDYKLRVATLTPPAIVIEPAIATSAEVEETPTVSLNSKVYIDWNNTTSEYYHAGPVCPEQGISDTIAVTLGFAEYLLYKPCPSCNPLS